MFGQDRMSSIFDHIYVKDPTVITNLKSTDPFFGDNVMVELSINANKIVNEAINRRDWRNYFKDILNARSANVNWNINMNDVQQYWNVFENLLINVIYRQSPIFSLVTKKQFS